MRGQDETRTCAEREFQCYLDLLRTDNAPGPEEFVGEQPPEVRRELRKMIADYQSLRDRLGDAAPKLELGRVLGDFQLVRELGRGGMSVVWEAEQLSLKRKVALKLLSPHCSLSEKSLSRFEREARAGGRLAHSGIVQTYGAGEADGFHYIAQELVAGGYTLADSLADLRETRELPGGYFDAVTRLFQKIAEALYYAHEQGVVHRDIKPSNILLTENDEPRVADFGLARIQDELSMSRTGDIEGTPYYMSPEQAAAKSMGLDHRTDVFSLGSTLYEALTLTRAFDGDTSQQVFRKILTVDPPDPRRLRSRTPRDLAVICAKALEKDPHRRYSDMNDLANDLHNSLANEPILARKPGVFARGWKWAKRHPVVSVVVVLGGLSLTAITCLALAVMEERDRAEIASTEAVEALQKSEWDLYCSNVNGAQLALESHRMESMTELLGDCPPQHRGWEWNLLRRTSDLSIACLDTEQIVARLDLGAADDLLVTSPGLEVKRSGALGLMPIKPLSRLDLPYDAEVQVWETGGYRRRTAIPVDYEVTSIDVGKEGPMLVLAQADRSVAVWDLISNEELYHLPTTAIDAIFEDDEDPSILDPVEEGLDPIERDLELVRRAERGRERAERGQRMRTDAARLWTGFTSREDHLLVAFEGGIARFDAKGGGLIDCVTRYSDYTRPSVVAVRADGQYLAMGSGSGVYLYHVNGTEGVLEHEATLQGGQGRPGQAFEPTRAICFSPDGHRLAAAAGTVVRVWDIDSGNLYQKLTGHDAEIVDVDFHPDQNRLATASLDGSVRLWWVPTGELIQVWLGHQAPVRCLQFDSDGSLLYSGSEDRTVRVWDVEARFPVTILDPAGDGQTRGFSALRAAGFRGRDNSLVWATADGSVGLRELSTSSESRLLQDREWAANVASAFTDQMLVVASGSTIRLWDIEQVDLEPTTYQLEEESRVQAVAVNGKGQIALVRQESTIGFIGADGRERSWKAELPLSVVCLDEFGHIAAGGEQGVLGVWDSATGRRVFSQRLGVEAISAIVLLGEERVLVASAEGRITLVDLRNGKQVRSSSAPDEVRCLRRSPDGTRIVGGCRNGVVCIWDIAHLDTLWTSNALEGSVEVVTFSADGSQLLAGTDHSAVTVWEVDVSR